MGPVAGADGRGRLAGARVFVLPPVVTLLRRDAPWLALMWVFSLLSSLSNLHLPWGRDQGIYAHAASEILDGAAPYAEIFVFKPPATIYVHALAMALFGRDMVAIRLLDVGWTAATVGVLYTLARAAGAPGWAAACGGVLFAWQYHDLGYWNSAQTDAWTNLFTGLALGMVAWPGRVGVARGLAAGAFAGAVFWFKYSLGAVLPLVVVLALVQGPRPPWPAALSSIAGILGSFLAVVVGLWSVDAWHTFLEIQNDTVLPYTGLAGEGLSRRDPWMFLKNLRALGHLPLTFAAVGVLGVGWQVARSWRDPASIAGLAALGWLSVGLLSAWSQGKFWSYQFQGALGGAALLGALGLAALAAWGAGHLARRLALLALTVGLTFHVPERLEVIRDLAMGSRNWDEVWGRYGNSGMRVKDNLAVAAYLQRTTRPEDRIFIWGYDPMIYVLSDRRIVSRFPYTYPMAVAWGPVEAYRDELMAALRADPPAAVLIGRRDQVSVVFGHKMDSEATLRGFPELTSFLQEHYGPRREVGRFLVVMREDRR
jgi:4-amino-4-deoxy-L-arabinose transferase-like glycosyltransferase